MYESGSKDLAVQGSASLQNKATPPYPPSIWMNTKGKGLQNLHFVTD